MDKTQALESDLGSVISMPCGIRKITIWASVFIKRFNNFLNYLLSIGYIPDTVLGTAMQDKYCSCSQGANILVGEMD